MLSPSSLGRQKHFPNSAFRSVVKFSVPVKKNIVIYRDLKEIFLLFTQHVEMIEGRLAVVYIHSEVEDQLWT